MLNSKAYANAAAIVVIAASFICWVITVVAPDLAFNVASSWFHMINLDVVRMSSTANFGNAIIGFVSVGAAVWVSVYAFAEIYNKLAKK